MAAKNIPYGDFSKVSLGPPSWDGEEEPWIRRDNNHYIRCPFCGCEDTVSYASSDYEDDNIRIELYCENARCDAREFVIMVRRSSAARRSDQLALERIDDGEIRIPLDEKFDFNRGVWTGPDLMEHFEPELVKARRLGLPETCNCSHCR